MASAIAYAWFASVAKQSNTVPLIQTPRPDLALRAENLYALSVSGFGDALNNPEKLDILCVDDLPESSPFPSHNFALVDHNRLESRFAKGNPNATVVSVIDHHEDEGLYKDTANPRIIKVPTGSCASLVADLIHTQSPTEIALIPELATLLICSIVIDTGGLKPKGKAEDSDRQAMAYLLPHSTFVPLPLPVPDIGPGTDFNTIPVLKDLTKKLKTKKDDVSHLGTRDLLRRDYKESTLIPIWAKDSQIQVGLASIPISFDSWIPKDKDFYSAVEGWVKERQLAALVILTSFDEKKPKKKSNKLFKKKGDKTLKGDDKKPKDDDHRRQLLVVVADNKDLASNLFPGLEKSPLGLQELSFEGFGAKKATGDFGWVLQGKVYKQGDATATRKVVAPIVEKIVQGPSNANL